jgi:hypothetical protein
MDGARDPIEAAEFIENGAADADFGVSFEGAAAFGIELADGIEQADQSAAVEIVGIDMGRQRHGQASNDIAHERQMLLDQLFFADTARRGAAISLRNANAAFIR